MRNRISAFAAHLRDEDARLPGEGGYQTMVHQLEDGIDLSERIASSLCRLPGEYDLDIEVPATLHTNTTRDDSGSSLSALGRNSEE